MSFPTTTCPANCRRTSCARSSSSSAGKSTPARNTSATAIGEPFAPAAARAPRRGAAGASRPMPRGRGDAATRADRGRARAAPRPRAPGQDRSSSCRRRPRGRSGRSSCRLPRATAAPRRAGSRAATPESSSWPISGCVRSAFRAVTGSRVTRRLRGESLVGGHVLHEAEQLGRERRLRQRLGAGPARFARAARRRRRPARPVDDAFVPDVDDLDVARAGRERGDQGRRGLAVERAAPLLEKRRLLGDLGVAVDVEQARPRSRPPRPRAARRPAARRGRRRARRSSGGTTTGSRRAPPAGASGSPACAASAWPCSSRRSGSTSRSSTSDAPDPRQVVQPDVVDERRARASMPRSRAILALERDRDVAETDRAVPRVEQGAGDDPDRVREVDDPSVRRGEGANAVGDLEHDRHGAHRLREPAGARRLLADATTGERDRLVAKPCRLAADAELEEDEGGARDGGIEIVGHRQRPGEALPLEHAGSHLARRPYAARDRCRGGRARRPAPGRARARARRRAPACTSSRRRSPRASSLHPRQCDALDKRLLREEEDDDDRKHHEHGRGHRQVPLHLVQ